MTSKSIACWLLYPEMISERKNPDSILEVVFRDEKSVVFRDLLQSKWDKATASYIPCFYTLLDGINSLILLKGHYYIGRKSKSFRQVVRTIRKDLIGYQQSIQFTE